MALEGAMASVEEMTYRTRARLVAHRDAGGTDEDFAECLVHEFVEQAKKHELGAGSIHMALSLYRMVLLQEQIWQLTDAVAMRDETLKLLWEIEDL